jgi:hypothetical protein
MHFQVLSPQLPIDGRQTAGRTIAAKLTARRTSTKRVNRGCCHPTIGTSRFDRVGVRRAGIARGQSPRAASQSRPPAAGHKAQQETPNHRENIHRNRTNAKGWVVPTGTKFVSEKIRRSLSRRPRAINPRPGNSNFTGFQLVLGTKPFENHAVAIAAMHGSLRSRPLLRYYQSARKLQPRRNRETCR